MRIRVMYAVTVEGVKYAPGVVEVGQGVGRRLVEEHRGNFEEALTPDPSPRVLGEGGEEKKEETRRARRAERGHGEETEPEEESASLETCDTGEREEEE